MVDDTSIRPLCFCFVFDKGNIKGTSSWKNLLGVCVCVLIYICVRADFVDLTSVWVYR